MHSMPLGPSSQQYDPASALPSRSATPSHRSPAAMHVPEDPEDTVQGSEPVGEDSAKMAPAPGGRRQGRRAHSPSSQQPSAQKMLVCCAWPAGILALLQQAHAMLHAG